MKEPDQASAGAKVRRVRSDRGLSLRALASRVGVSPATLSQIENGKTGLSVNRLDQIARALEMNASEILGGGPGLAPQSGAMTETSRSASALLDSSREVANPRWRVYGPLDLSPVLRAALDEILEVGYHGTSMRNISSRSGLSVAGIYNYFKSKQEMLVELHEITMDDLAARTRGALLEGSTTDPVGTFCLLIENLALYHTYRRELGFVGATELRALTPVNREVIVAKRNWEQSVIDEQVSACARGGLFTVRNPEDASRAVVSLCTALATWWRPEGRMSPEETARLYIGYALDLMKFDDSQRRAHQE